MHHMSLRQGFKSFSAKRRRTVSRENTGVLGEPDQFTRQKLQSPTGAPSGRARAGRRDQQGFLFAGELTARPRAWLFAERRLQVAEHEAALCPVHSGTARSDAP